MLYIHTQNNISFGTHTHTRAHTHGVTNRWQHRWLRSDLLRPYKISHEEEWHEQGREHIVLKNQNQRTLSFVFIYLSFPPLTKNWTRIKCLFARLGSGYHLVSLVSVTCSVCFSSREKTTRSVHTAVPGGANVAKLTTIQQQAWRATETLNVIVQSFVVPESRFLQ